jgi:hypothetical protein
MWEQRDQEVYTEMQKDYVSSPAQHVCLLSHNFTVLTETAKRDGGKHTCLKEET